MRRNAGEDFAPGNLFTDGDPNTSTPASVVGADILNIWQEELANLVTAAGLSIDQSNPYATNDKTQIEQAVRLLGGAGGGGGFTWSPVSGQAPSQVEEFGTQKYLFDNGLTQYLQAYLKVPSGYQVGKQITLRVALYSPSASGTILMRTRATLIKKNTTALDSTTNQRVSTNVALTNALANQYRETVMDLSSTDGKINSVTIDPGDIIKVELYRDTDLDTEAVRVIPEATEPKFT